VRKLKEIIANGELGKIHYIYSTRVNLGKVRKEESALWSLSVHDISVALYLLEEKPVSVTANGAFYLRDGIEDVAFATIAFQDKKIVNIHASWLDPHKVRKFTIVGSNEAKPEAGFISNESPLGSSFLDKKVGDTVSVTTPGGKAEYTILSIE